jgi:hypothetical protein
VLGVCLAANFNNPFVFVDAKVEGVLAAIDYYNVMSYVWSPSGNFERAKSAVAAVQAAGFPKAKINMGIAFYDHGSQDYCHLVRSCTNSSCTQECTAPSSNTCNGILFDGQDMQTTMGSWVAREGWGGVLIFQVNYDYDNLLLNALGAGLAAGSKQREYRAATATVTNACSSSALLPAGFPTVPCLDIPHCSDAGNSGTVNKFSVMGTDGGTAPQWISAPTSASVCWDETHIHVNWTATTGERAVQWNCSGTTAKCCHDKVWEKDAVEFYLAFGANASWDAGAGVHNVTEVDGGPKGGLWQGYINNSGYRPNQPSYEIPCDDHHTKWEPTVFANGFAGRLHVPWRMVPNAPAPTDLPFSIWRLNFYRWDRGFDPTDPTLGNCSAWSVTYCEGHPCNPPHVPKFFGVAQLRPIKR